MFSKKEFNFAAEEVSAACVEFMPEACCCCSGLKNFCELARISLNFVAMSCMAGLVEVIDRGCGAGGMFAGAGGTPDEVGEEGFGKVPVKGVCGPVKDGVEVIVGRKD